MLEVPLLPSYWSGARNSCYHSWPIQEECLWSHFFLLIGQEPATSVTTVVRIRVRKFRVFLPYLNFNLHLRQQHIAECSEDIFAFMTLVYVSCWHNFWWSSERIFHVFHVPYICQLLILFLLIIWENLPCVYDTYNLSAVDIISADHLRESPMWLWHL